MSAQTTLLFLIQVLVAIFANPDGAPLPACFDMIPQHGENKPSSGSVGAIIEVNNTDTKDLYAVTFKKEYDRLRSFKGFFIKSLDTEGNLIGRFRDSMYSKYVACDDIQGNSAITHISKDPKDELFFQWEAPTDFEGQVTFKYSVVFRFDAFWANVDKNVTLPASAFMSVPVSLGVLVFASLLLATFIF